MSMKAIFVTCKLEKFRLPMLLSERSQVPLIRNLLQDFGLEFIERLAHLSSHVTALSDVDVESAEADGNSSATFSWTRYSFTCVQRV